MKPLAAIASILLASVAGSSFAATTIDGMTVPVPTPRPAVTEMAQAAPDSGKPAAAAPTATWADPMTTGAVKPGGPGAEDLKAVDITRITVMRVDEMSDENERDRYRHMADGPSADVGRLQADIRDIPDLAAALQARQVDVEDIVEVQRNADGSVTFIVM